MSVRTLADIWERGYWYGYYAARDSWEQADRFPLQGDHGNDDFCQGSKTGWRDSRDETD